MSLFLFSLACFSACLSVVGNLVNVSVPDPYMDEIFHIPQAQQYCLGNFTAWDSKITTLPGLYLISVGIISPLNSLAASLTREPPDINSCSTQNLRSLNVLFGLINLSLVYCITAQLHGEKQGYSSNLAILNSLNLSLLPVLYMFNFLYYTDAVSTTMVLLTYSLHLAGTRNLSSLAGLCSVLCRQTNIVWVFLVAALAAGQTITPEVKHHLAKTKHPPTIPLTSWGQIIELCQGTWALSRKPWRFARLLATFNFQPLI
ncbi:putative Dol-P-Glc:Glc(2)Man(9)GlcNAc(2)-PP-Dol alpha-1,2-glucosyltransferase [Eurytemora carolleeae]|uniref:putative Dol-P-Glc:Glc(2)Man(9)GlcNAc(2)-PP-Dol alpha-1,2-glucosyltransferase n=1 Tax=Eurytemora carolleeae TaxID=1294199 RepID=UPI000C7795D7|nr:putative Dol-P-Glc:Glc(2)Man(9)GlcNAc(2)-PP-Dol alpha-1,2-glucosyltransferase [Eurytemora carolleeae]|eukprot:XP_023346640.1 putative Dol-P-Glc:Glc(2)Man(9)GlcNAc(2)-PP-Dol alpha-1,2-glucosyltransferase [Eurytemora affinis]